MINVSATTQRRDRVWPLAVESRSMAVRDARGLPAGGGASSGYACTSINSYATIEKTILMGLSFAFMRTRGRHPEDPLYGNSLAQGVSRTGLRSVRTSFGGRHALRTLGTRHTCHPRRREYGGGISGTTAPVPWRNDHEILCRTDVSVEFGVAPQLVGRGNQLYGPMHRSLGAYPTSLPRLLPATARRLTSRKRYQPSDRS